MLATDALSIGNFHPASAAAWDSSRVVAEAQLTITVLTASLAVSLLGSTATTHAIASFATVIHRTHSKGVDCANGHAFTIVVLINTIGGRPAKLV